MDEYLEVQGHRAYVGMTSEGEAAVGRIAIWAASVEENLADLCAELIDGSNLVVGHTVTANMSVSGTIDLAKRLLAESDAISAENKADTVAALNEAKAALGQRNKILHATVGEIMFGDKTAFFNRRKKGPAAAGQQPHWETTWHGVEELDEIGARLFRASEDLWGHVHLPPD